MIPVTVSIEFLTVTCISQTYAKNMYYLSRGIAENYVLKTYIHRKVCNPILTEKDNKFDRDNDTFRHKIGRDVHRRFRLWGSLITWRNSKAGLGPWFLNHIHNYVYLCLGISGGCIFFTVVVAIVFWQYYSRIKAEIYANLTLPKEFEVLHLRRGSQLDITDIQFDRDYKKRKTLHHHHKK